MDVPTLLVNARWGLSLNYTVPIHFHYIMKFLSSKNAKRYFAPLFAMGIFFGNLTCMADDVNAPASEIPNTDEQGFLSELASRYLADRRVDDKAHSNKIVFLDGTPHSPALLSQQEDSVRRKMLEYYYDQFRNSLDPDMPYFLFMSKGAEMTLGLGGGVRMRAFYDWNGAMPTNAFMPSTIPIPADPTSPRHFGATPSGTYINYVMIGHNKLIGDYGLYVEADFTGYEGLDFRLKKSYAMIRDFTFGYATSTFADPTAQPAIVDAAGPNNKFSASSLLVRWMPRFGKDHKWIAAVSVETPKTAVDRTNPMVKPVSNWLPDFAGFMEYEWEKGQHVRASAILRSLSYYDVLSSKRHNLAGWGVQLTQVSRPARALTLYTTLNAGQGYTSLGGDLVTGAYDLVPDPANEMKLYAPSAIGWCMGVQYNFKPNIFSTIAASQTHYIPKKGTQGAEYKSGTFVAANVFWSILPRLTVAAEYDWGMRRNISGAHKAASRMNLTAMWTF